MTFPRVKIASLDLSNERVLKVLRYVSFTSSHRTDKFIRVLKSIRFPWILICGYIVCSQIVYVIGLINIYGRRIVHDTIYPTVPHPYISPTGNTSANDRLREAYFYFTVCHCRIIRDTPSASNSCSDKLGYDTRHLPVSQSVMTLEVVVFVFCAFIFKLGVGSDIVFLCV